MAPKQWISSYVLLFVPIHFFFIFCFISSFLLFLSIAGACLLFRCLMRGPSTDIEAMGGMLSAWLDRLSRSSRAPAYPSWLLSSHTRCAPLTFVSGGVAIHTSAHWLHFIQAQWAIHEVRMRRCAAPLYKHRGTSGSLQALTYIRHFILYLDIHR